MKAAELNDQIEALRARMKPLQEQLIALEAKHDEALSREWIAANGVTLDQVQTTDVEGMFFHHIVRFAEWMHSQHPRKPWCEWNGRIYATDEIIAGRMDRDPAGRIEHVPAVSA